MQCDVRSSNNAALRCCQSLMNKSDAVSSVIPIGGHENDQLVENFGAIYNHAWKYHSQIQSFRNRNDTTFVFIIHLYPDSSFFWFSNSRILFFFYFRLGLTWLHLEMQNKETIDFLLMVRPPLLNRNIMHRRYVIDYHGTLNLETINNVERYSHPNIIGSFVTYLFVTYRYNV